MSVRALTYRRLLIPLSRPYSSSSSSSKNTLPPAKRLLQTATSPNTSAPFLPGLSTTPITFAPAAVPAKKPLRPRKSAITLTPSATQHLRTLLAQPTPQLIRIGVKNRGCSGLAYHLEYVDRPGKFDEEVVQDGVKVLIDSKALFSIIGSEMDWVEDKISARFVFRNPNIKEQCGCGESFSVG
ncbi:hypothetical protein B9Z19DRAFT_1089261 [Tuber borchii]|uniref:Iron-sulfur assembly protein 1 n=1 Tax=Tuber borchii TaxID=42251 RepID=A0A2T6ZKF3_TUBBO|nr:hypothetical protein B9Z19DRAFT_1089261 [Tuber borchii]